MPPKRSTGDRMINQLYTETGVEIDSNVGISGIKEPVEVRAHHLRAWESFLRAGGSKEAHLKWVGGLDAETTNYNGYGKQFVLRAVDIWTYLSRDPKTRVKITETPDVICSDCPKNNACPASVYLDDINEAYKWGVETYRTYTSRKIIANFLKQQRTHPRSIGPGALAYTKMVETVERLRADM